ncbi:zinc finger protein 37-like [Contarinia nasturtii]|uniref:zinc finger protein 37-like n=1 Tax=Contarinia nasturtii TaxID=265458 RepID=UPI0012D3A386|nr:zinc finger protein 37-like [Contarinia nasturtii]
MPTNNWTRELEKMLNGIERQATFSLQNISNFCEQSGQSFHQADWKYCLDRAKDRLKEIYSKFKSDTSFDKSRNGSIQRSKNSSVRSSISSGKNGLNTIIEISDDETANTTEVIGEIALSDVDHEIKTENDENGDQPSDGEIPNVEPKEEDEMENEEIPIVRIPANQLMVVCSPERVKIEKDENCNKDKGIKRERSNSPNTSIESDENNRTNANNPYRNRLRASKKNTIRERGDKRNAKVTNEEDNNLDYNVSEAVSEVNAAKNVASCQMTLDKWVFQNNKGKENKEKEQFNGEAGGQNKKKKSNIQRSNNKIGAVSKPGNTQTHEGKKLHQCDQCQKRFVKRCNLKTHMMTHTGEKPYQCNHCLKRFRLKSYLNDHIRAHTGDKRYQCDLCEKRFIKKSKLDRHIRTHTGEKPQQCDLCTKRFGTKCELKRHMRTHKDDLFHCSGCFRGFSQITEKEAHERDCKTRRFECYICNRDENKKKYVTTGKNAIVNHMRTHTGDKPHQCSQCQRRFNCLSNLLRHKKSHTGVKPHKCDHCHKRFTDKKGTKN